MPRVLYVVRGIGYTVLSCTMPNTPSGPVKSFTNTTIRDRGIQDIRTTHRQLKDPLGTNGHPTPHPLGIGGVGFHIPNKVAMNSMLICLNESMYNYPRHTPWARGRVSKKQAPLEIPPILLEDFGRGWEAIDNCSICANEMSTSSERRSY